MALDFNNITQLYNPPNEYGVDIAMPMSTPVQSLYSGTVVGAGRTQWSSNPSDSSGGYISILTNVPGLGDVVYYILHLDTLASGIGQGSTISAGEQIGTSGGQNSGGNWPAAPQYSTGTHIEEGFGNPFLTPPGLPTTNVDPLSYLQQASINVTGGVPSGSVVPATSLTTTGLIPSPTDIANAIANSIGTIVTNIIKTISQSDFVQRGVIISAGFVIVIVGIIILFIANGGVQKTAQIAEVAAA